MTAGAPAPGTPGYDQALIPFIRERAPDSWQGKQVNFWSTFIGTVTLGEAFPNTTADPAILPLLALEIWGLPTSQPAYDPNNKNFVYLRFQRGVMHFDYTTGTTQGVLLADWFKQIIIGEKLPADLAKDAKNSPFLKQYSRTNYRGLNRPDVLTGTDLTDAFEPGTAEVNATGSTANTGTITGSTPITGTSTSGALAPTAPITATQTLTGTTTITNEKLTVALQVGGTDHGRLTVRTVGGDLRAWTIPTLLLSRGRSVNLGKDTIADGAATRVLLVSDPALGDGKQLEAELPIRGSTGRARLLVTLYEGKPYLTMQLGVRGLPDDQPTIGFRLFDGDGGGWLDLSKSAVYQTEDPVLKRESFDSTALARTGEVQAGMPLMLNDSERNNGFVLATLDATDHFSKFSGKPSGETAGLRMIYDIMLAPPDQSPETLSPRLLLTITPAGDPNTVLTPYRRAVAAIYPTPRLPDWVRYQWTASAALGGGLSQKNVMSQIDYIASNLLDLGPWQIVIESGWYRANGRPDADGRAVDTDKFPDGMRALVDYAHKKGVRVVLGVPGPLVTRDGKDRTGLRNLVEQHSDWLIPAGDSAGNKYLLNFENAAFRTWWTDLIRDVLVTYDADGLRIDGYGEALAAVGKTEPRTSLQAAELYRLTAEQAWAAKTNAYIESGWYVPAFANPYVHVVRSSDEGLAFDRDYPNAGLRQHIDYALFQRIAVNQRAHLGDIVPGDIVALQTGYRWLESASALGGLTGISVDLTKLSESTLEEYRERLTHLHPFAGQTMFSFGTAAEVFATNIDGFTYLGVINRNQTRRNVTIKLSDFGISDGAIVRDSSSGTVIKAGESMEVDMPPASFRMYVMRQDAGWIWTTSTISGESARGVLKYQVKGPASVPGKIEIAVPPPAKVSLDGQTLAASAYSYDPNSGLLKLNYSHDRVHDIRIEYPADVSVTQRAAN